jgi:linoleoyl-CoA desaturase
MALSGSSPMQWSAKHIVAHHVDTNVTPVDSDTMYPIKRVLFSLDHLWLHQWQHLYMWAFYPFTVLFWTLSNLFRVLAALLTGTKIYEGSVEVRHETTADWIETCLVLGVSFSFRILLPFALLPFKTALATLVFNEAACGIWFALQFAVNHEVEECVGHEKSLPFAGQNMEKMDWGKFQVISSHNYAVESRLALHLSGGLNNQVEHHLFPSVHYRHYAGLSRIVRQTCKEFNIPYTHSSSFFVALVRHYHHLRNMGAKQSVKQY